MSNTKIQVDTVGLGINWQLGETYRVALDEGFLFQADGLKLPLAGNPSAVSFSTPLTAPEINTTNPAFGTTANIGVQTISYSISRANINVLGGNVYVNRQGSPNVVVRTYPVNSSNTTGNVVTIPIVGNLEANLTYFVTSDANIFLDNDGFKNAAITNSNSFTFISPTAPLLTAQVPANGTVAEKQFTNVAITFDRTITANSGNVYLRNANTNAIIRTYNVNSDVAISNATATFDIVGSVEANQNYYFTSNANIFQDATLIKYPGISSANVMSFTAPVAPFVQSTLPADNNSDLSRNAGLISFTLDRNVSDLGGNVYLYNNANAIIKTWTIGTDVNVSASTYTLPIDIGLLESLSYYYVKTDSNIARDTTHINFPGITSDTAFNFTTRKAPELISTEPVAGQAQDEDDNTISFTLDDIVEKVSGNVYLYRVDNVGGNTLIKTYDIDSNVSLSLAPGTTTATLNTTGLLPVMEQYYVLTDFDTLVNSNGDKFRGIRSNNEFYFQTAVDRTYAVNNPGLMFPDNIPQITEADTGATYQITLVLSDAIGQLQQQNDNFASPPGWNAATNTYTITGNKTECNSQLANLYFFPYVNEDSTATITFTQSKNSVLQKTIVFSITAVGTHTWLDGINNTVSVPEDSKTNMLFRIYPTWDSNCVVMIKSLDSSDTPTDSLGAFNSNSISGWTNISDGIIYKEYSRPANVSVLTTQQNEIASIYYWLASDSTTPFKLNASLGIESSRSGNILVGGTIYSGTNSYTVSPSDEYMLTTETTYAEDTIKQLTFSIVDADTHPDITYNVTVTQISPDPGLVAGAFTTPGISTKQYGTITDTQVKSAWTNAIYYYPPADYTETITLGLSAVKIQPGKANIQLANNVAVTLTNVTTHNEYAFALLVYGEDTQKTITYAIQDLDLFDPTYYVTISQSTPDSATFPANIIVNGVDYGTTYSVAGSRAAINTSAKSFYPYPDYTGPIVFDYTQIKSSHTGNITQASNVAITYTNNATHNDYGLDPIRAYVEDATTSFRGATFISDIDSRFTNYYTTFEQISPDPELQPVDIIINNVSYGNVATVYGSRSVLNGYTHVMTPPADFEGNIVLGYTQIKSTAFGNITQASNVAITFTNAVRHDEYTIPFSSASIYSNILTETDFAITDQAPNKEYEITVDLTDSLGNLYIADFADPYITNVKLLIQADDKPNGSFEFIDSSQSNKPITRGSSTFISTEFFKWGTGSVGFPLFRSQRHLRTPTSDDFHPSGDFTAECWAYNIRYFDRKDNGIFSQWAPGNPNQCVWQMGIGQNLRPSAIVIYKLVNSPTNYSLVVEGPDILEDLTWHHMAFVRSGLDLYLYVNGNRVASQTLPANAVVNVGTAPFHIGWREGENDYIGYLDDLRITKNLARYTGETYTVPTAKFPGRILKGNTLTVSGNISTVNSQLATISVLPPYSDGIATGHLTYNQIQSTDNIVQANDISIPITLYPIPETPGAPSINIVSNTFSNVSATITVTPPELDGSVIAYNLRVQRLVSNSVVTGPVYETSDLIIAPNNPSVTLSNLIPGGNYGFSVNASSNYGTSPNSLFSSVQLYTPPAPPTNISAVTLSNSSAQVSYSSPQISGGRGITSYTAVSTPGNITATYTLVGFSPPPIVPINVTGLTPNTEYTFKVYATSVSGNSELSVASNTITTDP
jgi:hypothetical protein